MHITMQATMPAPVRIRTRLDWVEPQQLARPFGLRFRHPQGELSEAVAAVLLVQKDGRNLGHLEGVLHELGPERLGLGQDAGPAFHSGCILVRGGRLTTVGRAIACWRVG